MDFNRQLDIDKLSAPDLRVGLRKPGLNAETRDYMQQRLCYLTSDARKVIKAKWSDFYRDWLLSGGLDKELNQ